MGGFEVPAIPGGRASKAWVGEWDALTPERRRQNALRASRIGAAKRRGTGKTKVTNARSQYRPGKNPNSHQHRARYADLMVAVNTAHGWTILGRQEYRQITIRQSRLLEVMASYEKMHWGALAEISERLGMLRKSAWSMTNALVRKFGVNNRHQLHAIAKQISKTRGRGRSSNRVFQFAVGQSLARETNAGLGASTPANGGFAPRPAPSRAL